MVTKDLGMVTAYAYAVAGGYTGTEAQFEQLMADLAIVVDDFDNFSVTVTTLPAGSSATASYSDGVLSLGIPKGDKGDKGNTGDTGATPNLSVGTVETTAEPIVTITGTAENPVLNFGLVKGDKGDTGEVSLSELEDATVVQTLSDNEPYNYRRTNNGNGSGHREYDEIVGASVGWNQLVNTTDTSVTIQSGHKYYSNINNVKAIGLSNGTAISINDGTKDNITDLTLMNSQIADYVYSLEQSTAGSGVTWLRNHFPKLFDNGYQPFDSGSIKSVSGLTAHVMCDANDNIIGNYPLDSSVTLRGQYKLNNGQLYAVGDVWKSSGSIERSWIEDTFDGSENWILRGSGDVTHFTLGIGANGSVVDRAIVCDKYPQLVITGSTTDVGINVFNSSAYGSAVVAVRPQNANGMTTAQFKALLEANPITAVYGISSSTTESATTYDNPQLCDANGTEEYVGSELPVGHSTDYPMTLVDTMPSANGTYEPRVTIANGKRTITWVSV